MSAGTNSVDRMMRWKTVLDLAMTLAIIAACATLIWALVTNRGDIAGRPVQAAPEAAGAVRRTPPPVPKEPVSLAGAPVKGSQAARVAIIQYAEFECPYCARFAAETLPLLEREYVDTGRVLLAFRHLPLERIHPSAVIAAAGAECAARQDRFWDLHDRLFTLSPPFTVAAVRAAAEAVALDAPRFSTCLAGDGLARVREDMASARQLGITGTPTFLIGGVEPDGRVRVRYWLSGARPFAQFATILDGLLKGLGPDTPTLPQQP